MEKVAHHLRLQDTTGRKVGEIIRRYSEPKTETEITERTTDLTYENERIDAILKILFPNKYIFFFFWVIFCL